MNGKERIKKHEPDWSIYVDSRTAETYYDKKNYLNSDSKIKEKTFYQRVYVFALNCCVFFILNKTKINKVYSERI